MEGMEFQISLTYPWNWRDTSFLASGIFNTIRQRPLSACRYGLPDDSDDENAPSKPPGGPEDQLKPAADSPDQEAEDEGMQLSKSFTSACSLKHVQPNCSRGSTWQT